MFVIWDIIMYVIWDIPNLGFAFEDWVQTYDRNFSEISDYLVNGLLD